MPPPCRDPLAVFALQQAARANLARASVLPRPPAWLARLGRRPDPWPRSRPWPRPRTLPARLGRLARNLLIALVSLHVLYFGAVALTLTVWKFSNPGATSLMLYRVLTQGTRIKAPRYIPYEQIPASTRNAFINLEDHDFWEHFGVSPGAIRDAMRRNAKIGRTVYGGSTITQQAARSLFLTPDRNLVRKYLEAGTAVLMELILGKRRILELYLNYIEFGPGVFGLGAAARHHYGTAFSKLNAEQRLRLAVIITSPLKYDVNTLWKNRGMAARYRALMP